MAKQQIILVGANRGHQAGDKVSVDEKRAAELVRAGAAKYPPHSKAAEKTGS